MAGKRLLSLAEKLEKNRSRGRELCRQRMIESKKFDVKLKDKERKRIERRVKKDSMTRLDRVTLREKERERKALYRLRLKENQEVGTEPVVDQIKVLNKRINRMKMRFSRERIQTEEIERERRIKFGVK